MTLPTGALSFSQLQAEFGGANPISLSEYYRGGTTGYVPAGTAAGTSGTAVSTSGAIKLGDFRGTRRFAVQSAEFSVTAVSTAKGIQSGNFFLYNDGTCTGGSWGLPTTSSIGAGYWCYATNSNLSGGSVTSGAIGSWVQLSSTQVWTFKNSASTYEGTGTTSIAIAASQGGAVLGTITVDWDVGYTGG